MSRKYAEGTKVSEFKSASEIQLLLKRHGCQQVGTYDDVDKTVFMFALDKLTYRITMNLPDRDHQMFQKQLGNQYGPKGFSETAYDGECRRRWRSLVLCIKAKLVAVQDDIESFEQSFLPYMVTGDGRTVGELVIPKMQEAAALGTVPSQLALPGVSK